VRRRVAEVSSEGSGARGALGVAKTQAIRRTASECVWLVCIVVSGVEMLSRVN
jgi:hypothetical protein